MGQFRRFLSVSALKELHLSGRLYTWSNECAHPTLERIDWASSCSDHAPLLLRTNGSFTGRRRFHFRLFWPKEVLQHAWHCPVAAADMFFSLDWMLWHTTSALQSWSTRFISNVRVQLVIANELVLQLESARDHRALVPHEENLRKEMKLKSLGLSSLQRSIARQESQILWLGAGDVPTEVLSRLRQCQTPQEVYSVAVIHIIGLVRTGSLPGSSRPGWGIITTRSTPFGVWT
jgi:hypothetical protein